MDIEGAIPTGNSKKSNIVEIDGFQIQFPFEPYEIQKDLMKSLIQCLKSGENGLLESPTGTGKTLSLLCAAVAWQKKEKEFYQSMISNPNLERLSQQSNKAIRAGFEPPKIIYSSRTHTQLSQAAKELKKSYYNSTKSIVLGSRDHLCIHPDVQRIPNSSGKILACKTKVHRHVCKFYNNVQSAKEHLSANIQKVVDIEDLVLKGKIKSFCPFFMSRELVKDADIVFMPYNYILDPKIRVSHGIDIRNCVIILDEGHNIPKLCEESVSFEIRNTQLALVLSELTKAMMEFNNGDVESLATGPLKELSLGKIVRIKETVLKLEGQLETIEVKQEGNIVPTERLVEILEKVGITYHSAVQFAIDLDMVATFLTGRTFEATGCSQFGSIMRVIATSSQRRSFSERYKVYVQNEQRRDNRRVDFRMRSDHQPKVFNFWCFDPSLGLEMLTRYEPRSIILASGTLSPMDSFSEELVIPFPVTLSNNHIIADNQLFVGVFKHGPNGAYLSSTFENRKNDSYINGLGSAINSVLKVVPGGVLVFFPSYELMGTCVDSWKRSTIYDQLQQCKQLVVESKGSDKMKEVLDIYNNAVRSGGACMLAVCRGKVAEGVDFSDNYGRAVVLTGIPYSPAMNPQVLAKKAYMDLKSGRDCNRKINGSAWYQLEACRALNQAVGRIIRHAHDYGAIIFFDARCGDNKIKSQLPTWVSSRMKHFDKFDTGMTGLSEFFGTTFQEQRREAEKIFLVKQAELDPENFTQSSVYDEVHSSGMGISDEQLFKMYSRDAQPGQKEQGCKLSCSISTHASPRYKITNSLFADLNKTPTQENVPELKFAVPSFNPSLSKVPNSSLDENQTPMRSSRKRIKVISPSAHQYTISDSRNRVMENNAASALVKESSIKTTEECWRWVKKTLEGETFSRFGRAVRTFKQTGDIHAFALEVKVCFPIASYKICSEAMATFLKPNEVNVMNKVLFVSQ